MEAPPAFKFPPKGSQPLQTLSPERVNGSRPVSTASLSSKTSRTSDSETAFPPPSKEGISSTHSSPTRKANLFSDYHPSSPSKQQASAFGGLPLSPSLPEIGALRGHTRTNSDVQGLVKRFEHLDVRDRDAESAERRRKQEAELRRAQIAREEAESDARRLREEIRRIRRERDEGMERERKVGRRLEVVMEEYASAKEQYASQHTVYEKELRKARKEAYKTSSAVIKLQEELKATRNSLRITHSGLDVEKQKVQYREQETFNAQYQLAAVQEEMDKLRTHLKIVEEEKEALKTSLKEEEVARIATEGMIALPASQEDDADLLNSPGKPSPKKRRPTSLSDDKENISAGQKQKVEHRRLQEELLHEQIRREQAEEMLEFLRLECRFGCCSCQSHRGQDDGSAHVSPALSSILDRIVEEMKSVLTPQDDQIEQEDMQVDPQHAALAEDLKAEHVEVVDMQTVADEALAPEQAETNSPPEDELDRSTTMTAEDEPPQPEQEPEQTFEAEEEEPMVPHPTPAEPLETEPTDANAAADANPTPSIPSRPRSIRTITTTTTIPMHFTPHKHHNIEDAENIPPAPFDRAAALAAIEYRRGRAKSFAAGHMTPRKQMIEGRERRDISAPALGGKAGGSAWRGGAVSMGRVQGRGRLG